MPRPRDPAFVAVLTACPPVRRSAAPGIAWCTTAAEVVALAREGAVHAVAVDARAPGADLDLVALLRRYGPVLVVASPGDRVRWQAAGVPIVAELPSDAHGIRAAVAVGAPPMVGPPSVRRAPVVAVLAAPGGSGAATAATIARWSRPRTPPPPGDHHVSSEVAPAEVAPAEVAPDEVAPDDAVLADVVLADLTLDAPHRAAHGLDLAAPGLPELVASGRFGSPSADVVARTAHRTRYGYAVVPGLRRHCDWVSVGERSARTALEALRAACRLVVVHVDHDLEGLDATGSIDVEDRNVLARTGVRAAAAIVVAGGAHPSDHVGTAGALAMLDGFGVDRCRVLVVPPLRPGSGRRMARAIAKVLEQASARDGVEAGAPHDVGPEPEVIAPGTLGHWRQEVDGWITPSVPQQP